MTHSDDEFDAILTRRKRLFGGTPSDDFEPPKELDRLVLRQAREAIRPEVPARVYQGPRWAAPLAVAATVVLTFSIIMNLERTAPIAAPEVRVQPAAARMETESPPVVVTAPNYRSEKRLGGEGSASIVDLSARAPQKERLATESFAPPPAPAPAESAAAESAQAALAKADAPAPAPRNRLADAARTGAPVSATANADGAAAAPPAAKAEKDLARYPWRRDTKSWLQEIERLKSLGQYALAERELAEFHRHYPSFGATPGAPDR